MSSIRSVRTLVLVLLVASVCLAGTAAAAADISVTGDAVEPDPALAVVGEPVMFTNDGEAPVRLIDDDGRWDSGELQPGGTFQITFNEAGVVRFSSEDGTITGSVEVTAAADGGDGAESDGSQDDAADETGDRDDGVGDTADGALQQPTALAATGISAALIAAGGVAALAIGILLLVRTRKE